jgi:hypothetical protein
VPSGAASDASATRKRMFSLTGDALERVDELLDDLALCARTDPVDPSR